MQTALQAAPEIDRLVWTVSRGVAPKHGQRLRGLAAPLELDSLDPFSSTADFFLATAATADLIARRMPYRPRDDVTARLAALTGIGLIEERNGKLGATARVRPLLETMRGCETDVATSAWTGHEDQMATVTTLARTVALAAPDDHVVAAVHRGLPSVTDPYLLLFDRLVTLRYIRQHDHVAAWQVHGLTAPGMVAMTALWQGETVNADHEGVASLAERGLATVNPPDAVVLTAAGMSLRGEIEADTNERAGRTFDVLDEGQAAALLTGLRSLPGSG
jgi:hypothetical protein